MVVSVISSAISVIVSVLMTDDQSVPGVISVTLMVSLVTEFYMRIATMSPAPGQE